MQYADNQWDLILTLEKWRSQEYGWDMKKALDELYSSETYKRLCNPACGLYYEGAVYVFSYLENEIETGVVK